MNRLGWRVALVLAALLLVLGALYTLATRLDAAAAFPERPLFRSLIRLDAELNRDLLLLRSGLLRYYDPVNATLAGLYQRLEELGRTGPEALHENLPALAEVIKTTEDNVEQFKSDIAVSRNSIMYMTLLTNRRFEQTAAGEDAVLSAMLARLDNALVRYFSNPRGETRKEVQIALQAIDEYKWPARLRAEVHELAVHAGVVLQRATRIDETLSVLRMDPLGEQVRRIEQLYAEYARNAAERAHRYWIAILGVALLLVLYVTYAFLRLRHAEAELAGSEARFRATFEQAAVGMAQVALDGRWLRVNQKSCDILGYTAAELMTRSFQDITHPDDLASGIDYMRSMLEGRIATFTVEKRYLHKNGSPVWANLTVSLVRAKAGQPDYFIAVIEDIGARKRIELEHERLAALIEASSEFIGTATLDGQVTYLNPAGCKLLGLDPAEAVCKTIFDFVSPEFLSQVQNVILPTVMRDGFWSGEFRLRHFVTGEEVTVQQYVFIIKDPRTGVPAFLANISHDIRQRKQAEQEIHQLNTELEQRVQARTAQLEAANRQLDSFAYSASHDLRTPLRAIDGFSQALLEDCGPALGPDGRDYLARVRGATLRMAQLIDDLLRFSRVTRIEITPGDVNLSKLARLALTQLAQTEPRRQVETYIAEPLLARGDARLLAVVLDNLLGNAWKYTSKTARARIEFAAEQRADETVFYVRDNGAGFDMQYAGKLFGVFQRLHHIDEFPGTGVGLATVANIINRHGGRIWAESVLKQGSTFYFTLPAGSRGAKI